MKRIRRNGSRRFMRHLKTTDLGQCQPQLRRGLLPGKGYRCGHGDYESHKLLLIAPSFIRNILPHQPTLIFHNGDTISGGHPPPPHPPHSISNCVQTTFDSALWRNILLQITLFPNLGRTDIPDGTPLGQPGVVMFMCLGQTISSL